MKTISNCSFNSLLLVFVSVIFVGSLFPGKFEDVFRKLLRVTLNYFGRDSTTSKSVVITNNYEKYGFLFQEANKLVIEASAPLCVYVHRRVYFYY